MKRNFNSVRECSYKVWAVPPRSPAPHSPWSSIHHSFKLNFHCAFPALIWAPRMVAWRAGGGTHRRSWIRSLCVGPVISSGSRTQRLWSELDQRQSHQVTPNVFRVLSPKHGSRANVDWALKLCDDFQSVRPIAGSSQSQRHLFLWNMSLQTKSDWLKLQVIIRKL